MTSTRSRAPLLLTGAWLVYFARQILTSGVPFRRDALFVHLPARQFIRESLLHGSLPQWYPYEGVGVPFIGQIVTATFHPQTLLFLPLAAPEALKWNTLFAYLFGLIGAYKLARSFGASRLGAWMGGAALAFGGYALSMSDNLPYLVSLCTLPWVGWAGQRLVTRRRWKDAALLGVLWASIFLGGDAQMFALAPVLLLVPVVISWRREHLLRWLTLLVTAGLIASLCCGAELLPALVVYRHSAREAGQFVIDYGTYWALSPWRLIELVTPGFLPPEERIRLAKELFGNRFVWSASLFAGGIVIWLAIAGLARRERTSWSFGTVALLAVWMAMGSRGGLYVVATKIVPPLAMFRFPEKYMALFWVALVPLVALGWDHALQRARTWSLVAVVMAILAGAASTLPLPSSAWGHGLLVTTVFLGLSALCLLLPRTRWVIALLLVAELWRGNAGYFPLVPPSLMNERTNPIALEVKQGTSRGLAPPRVLNLGSPHAVTSDSETATETWVRDSMLLMRPDSAGITHVGVIGRSALPGYGGRPRELFGPFGIRAPQVAGLLNACFQTNLTPEGVMATPLPCRPRAYFATLRKVADSKEALNQIEAGLGPDQAVWEGPRDVPLATGSIQWLAWKPGAFELRVQTRQEAGLVISEGIAAGWTARIDGVRVPLVPANVAVMAVLIPPGVHHLTVKYQNPGLWLGLAFSLLGLGTALLLGSRR